MPLSKKKTASKSSKSGASRAKKAPVANKPRRGTRSKSAAKKPAVTKKSAAVAKAASNKASAKLKTATTNKKVSTKRAGSKSQGPKTAAGKKPGGNGLAAKKPVKNKLSNSEPEISSAGIRSNPAKVDKIIAKPADFKKELSADLSKSGASPVAKAVANTTVTRRKKSHESGLAESVSQGLAKQAQKKRGWRDIEALTERARLKNLLSDIWHEDIDLDSDIFGETDQFSSYYTDKEEEIEVEEDEDEEWEEFEEDES